MAQNVSIVVEARVGDAVAQMELTAAAVRQLGDEGERTGNIIGDDSNSRSMSSRLSGLRRTLSNIGDRGPLGSVVRGFGNLASAMLAPIDLGVKFAQSFEQIGSLGQILIGTFSSLGIGIVGLTAIVFAAVVAATALADILGTLIAIAADLVAPVTLLGGLLTGLAAGFVIAGKRAADGGPHLNSFADLVDKLGSMFQRTSTILAQVFLPYLVELGHAAAQALTFLDKIVRLPLAQAFHKIDTEGVKMLGQFVDRVAEVLSKPIRLAFHVAFEDSAFSAMVSDWWHRFTGFLFGSIEQHPIRLPSGRIIRIDKKQVDGIFQPLVDWFSRHHFTEQGIKIGHQILAGILNSGMQKKLATFAKAVLVDAFKNAAKAVVAGPLVFLGHGIRDLFQYMIHQAGRASTAAGNAIKHYIGSAWDWVKQKVSGVWDWVVSKVESALTVHINWPSPPSWFSDLLGGAGGVVSDIGNGLGGFVPGVATGPSVMTGARSAIHVGRPAPAFTIHIHGADLSDGPTQRRVAQKLSRALTQDWARRAGGH